MKKFFSDFKAFISKGNVVDMAIGVIVGGAFGKIVTSLVNDIIMPLVGLIAGGRSLSDLAIVLNDKPRYLADGSVNPEALLWHYGNFIQTIIDFLIIAICVFLMLKLIMKIKQAGSEAKESVEKAARKLTDGKEEKAAEEIAEPAAEVVAEAAAAEPETPPTAVKETQEDLLREIRDLLKSRES